MPEKCVRPREFHPARVESPGRPPENHREQQVWYAIDHANEVWAAEAPGGFMVQMPNMPWNFYTDVARWSYDEMRHAQLGARRLNAWGFEMGVDYPMVGDPVDAIYEKGGGPLEILALLYYFEKDAPAHRMVTKKEFGAMDDTDTAIDTDYDWADEAIHLKYGFTWLQHIVGADKPDELKALVERAGEMWNTWLAERWEKGEDLYGPYMERIEARIRSGRQRAVPMTVMTRSRIRTVDGEHSRLSPAKSCSMRRCARGCRFRTRAAAAPAAPASRRCSRAGSSTRKSTPTT